ncbi:MAG: hypothetical protein ACODAD_15450 [Planctomycetota bacterium]
MNRTVRWAILFMVAAAIGCQQGSESVEDPGLSRKELITEDLRLVVENEQMGSEMMSIQNNLETLKSTDAALAEELLEDLEELEGMSGSAAKSKANEMIAKLEEGG